MPDETRMNGGSVIAHTLGGDGVIEEQVRQLVALMGASNRTSLLREARLLNPVVINLSSLNFFHQRNVEFPFRLYAGVEKQNYSLGEIVGVGPLGGNATVHAGLVEHTLQNFQMLRFENAAPSRGA